MTFEEKLRSQKIIIGIALILMSLISFNFAVKRTFTTIAFLLGLVFLGMAFFVLLGLKKKKGRKSEAIGARRPSGSEER